ncbi:MAG: transporter, family, multidrug resistance protein [Actinomycetota bacterium]|jgi:MFS family permease|nr:transporter, family, multidrug resistance protein [Actinomycetota bacterium]
MPASLRGLPRETFVLALVAFCVALGFGIVVPAVPLFALQFGVGTTAAGAVVSAFALMRLLSGIGGGRLVDRAGERVALIVGIVVVAVSSLFAGLAVNYPQLLVFRAIGGIGSAIFTIASTSLLLRVASAAQRGQTQSVYRGGFLLGGIIGPAFGGAVIGVSLRAPFFLYTITLSLAALVAITMLPRGPVQDKPAQVSLGVAEESAAPEGVVPTPRTTLRAALAKPSYQAALAGNFAVGFSVLGVRSTVVPLLVVKKLHLAPGWIGAAFVVAALVQGALLLPAGKAVDEIGRRPMLILGGFLTAASLIGLALITGPATLLLAMGLFAVGGAVMGVAPAAILGDVLEGKGGTAVAVWQMASDLGSVIGPVAAGVLIEHGSFGTALAVSSVVVGACTLLGFRVPGGGFVGERSKSDL